MSEITDCIDMNEIKECISSCMDDVQELAEVVKMAARDLKDLLNGRISEK